jgi:uncharacterized OsmC-like protein
MEHIEVRHDRGNRYEIEVRGHRVVADQPEQFGGEDLGPTPTELFVAGLASCVAYYAGRFLVGHGLPMEGLAVSAGFEMSTERPARVAAVEMTVTLPASFPTERREALHRVVEHCTVHNSITQPPDIRIALRREEHAA